MRPPKHANVAPTHVGDREVHIVPAYEVPQYYPGSDSIDIDTHDPIRRVINPRRALTADYLNIIRTYLPSATGIRILIVGLAIVFYRNKKEIMDDWMRDTPSYIGGLPVGYIIDDFRVPAMHLSSINRCRSLFAFKNLFSKWILYVEDAASGLGHNVSPFHTYWIRC